MAKAIQILLIGLLFAPPLRAQSHPVECPEVQADTTGWATHEIAGFTIKLPERYTYVPRQGIDSLLGMWIAEGDTINFDYGYYSNRLLPNVGYEFPDFSQCRKWGGPDVPRIVAYRPYRGSVRLAGHWTKDWSREMQMKLTLGGSVLQENELDELLSIIESVKISYGDW